MNEINIPEIWKNDVVRSTKGPPCPVCEAELSYWLTGPKTGATICPKCGWEPQSSIRRAIK